MRIGPLHENNVADTELFFPFVAKAVQLCFACPYGTMTVTIKHRASTVMSATLDLCPFSASDPCRMIKRLKRSSVLISVNMQS